VQPWNPPAAPGNSEQIACGTLRQTTPLYPTEALAWELVSRPGKILHSLDTIDDLPPKEIRLSEVVK
jgi:hypothetical protein